MDEFTNYKQIKFIHDDPFNDYFLYNLKILSSLFSNEAQAKSKIIRA